MSVYFIQSGGDGPVKIGVCAQDIEARLASLQCGNPEPLRLLGSIEGSFQAEAALHRRYEARRLRGEWFRYCPTMMDVIAAGCVDVDERDARVVCPALAEAIEMAGGNAALARHVGVTPQAISQWKRVPADKAIKVEEATGGTISRHALRPDVFGEAA